MTGTGGIAVVLAAALAAPAAFAGDEPEELGREKKAAPREISTGSVRDRIGVERELRALRTDINILNLVNGLHLTPHQVLHVLRAAREAKEARADGEAPAKDPDIAERELKCLERIRAAMLAGEDAPEDAVRDIDNLRTRVRAPAKPWGEVVEVLVSLEDGIEAELLPSQREVVRTYKPCLVPPQDLRDPVRVGQASDSSPWRSLLERVVEVPAAVWEREGAGLVDRVVEQEQEHVGRYNPADEKDRKEALRRAFAEARAMDAATFEMKKDRMADRLQPRDRVEANRMELRDIQEASRAPGMVAAVLLDPRVIPILEERLARMKAEAKSAVDLDAVKEADRCKDGHCAIRREKPEKAEKTGD